MPSSVEEIDAQGFRHRGCDLTANKLDAKEVQNPGFGRYNWRKVLSISVNFALNADAHSSSKSAENVKRVIQKDDLAMYLFGNWLR